ncbi:MAG: hypothetical protein ABL940_12625, partial [Bacteroidia bacterium]
ACKKTETLPEVIPVVNTPLTNGVPTDKKQNGYFYSALSAYSYTGGSSSINYNVTYSAGFNDPEVSMPSSFNHYNNNQIFISPANVDVGNISINGTNVNKNISNNNTVFYFGNTTTNAPANFSATWITAGNKTFVPLNVTLPRGYPIINYSALGIPVSMYRSAGYTLNFNNNIANYDSLIVILDNFSGNKIRKVLTTSESTVTFTPQELSQFPYNSLSMNIYTFNYTYQTVNNKKMVFESSNQYNVQSIYLYN